MSFIPTQWPLSLLENNISRNIEPITSIEDVTVEEANGKGKKRRIKEIEATLKFLFFSSTFF